MLAWCDSKTWGMEGERQVKKKRKKNNYSYKQLYVCGPQGSWKPFHLERVEFVCILFKVNQEPFS